MKQLLLILFSILISLSSISQMLPEKVYNYSIGTTKINTTTYKYFLMDVVTSQCRIYNMDHSLYKTISCPVPANNFLYDIKFVSGNVFNTDNLIELYYSYYEWVTTTTGGSGTSGYYKYGAKVINENGNVILDCNNALYAYILKVSDTEGKLFLYLYDNSVNPYKIWTNIYSLSGDANAIISLEEKNLKSLEIETDAYPIPTNDNITIYYEIPENNKTGNLKIFNQFGIEVKSYIVDNTFENIIINTSEFDKGMYLYFIECGNIKSETKKFIIQ